MRPRHGQAEMACRTRLHRQWAPRLGRSGPAAGGVGGVGAFFCETPCNGPGWYPGLRLTPANSRGRPMAATARVSALGLAASRPGYPCSNQPAAQQAVPKAVGPRLRRPSQQDVQFRPAQPVHLPPGHGQVRRFCFSCVGSLRS